MYISDEEADTEEGQADQTQQAQTQQQETDGRSSSPAGADADKIQQSPRKTKPIVLFIERNTC